MAKLELWMATVDISARKLVDGRMRKIASVPVPASRRGEERRPRTDIVVRPEIDIEKMGDAVFALAIHLAHEGAKESSSSNDVIWNILVYRAIASV